MKLHGALLLCAFLSAPAALAAEQWSTPTTTQQWSMPATSPNESTPHPAPPGTAATTTQPWAPAPKTERRSLENQRLSPALKPDSNMVGAWEVRVPTAVTYYSKETNVYRRLTPGADLAKLVIQPSGAYRWGKTQGKLQAIAPWFAQPDVRYFEAANAQGSYILYAKDAQELVVLFDVGGFAAKGSRSR